MTTPPAADKQVDPVDGVRTRTTEKADDVDADSSPITDDADYVQKGTTKNAMKH